MLTTFKESLKTYIYTQNSNEDDDPVGILLDFVINPDTGKIEAFWVHTFLEGMKIMLPESILNWNKEMIKIQDHDDLVDPEKILKLKKIFEKEVPIFKSPVFEEGTHKKIGKVIDFGFDTKFPQILNIHVKKYFFSLYFQIIPLLNITKINSKGIFILDSKQSKLLEDEIKKVLNKKEEPLITPCSDKK